MQLRKHARFLYQPPLPLGKNGRFVTNSKPHWDLAGQIAAEGTVLLKNDGALPLTTRTVALYGPGASMTIKGGTGSGEVNERHSVTVLEGLRNRGFTIATEKWLTDFAAFYREAEAAYKVEKRKRLNLFKLHDIMQMLFDNFRTPAGPAITETYLSADTDSCVYVPSRQAGEGGDRKLEKGDYLLTDEEVEAIRVCAGHYEKFVLVINCGSGMDLSALDGIEGINAILHKFLQQLNTIHTWHLYIGENHIIIDSKRHLKSLLSVSRQRYLVPLKLNDILKGKPDAFLIIYNQYFHIFSFKYFSNSSFIPPSFNEYEDW